MTNKYFTADEIQKKYGIKDFELFEEIKNGLPVYSKGDPEKPLKPDQIEIDEFIYQERKEALNEHRTNFKSYIGSWIPYHIKDCLFLDQDLEKIGCKVDTKKELVTKNHISRRHQKARERCRDVTAALLQENPKILIADAIFSDRMSEAAKKIDGSLYTEKIIRGWIKDLFPAETRKPGRRPKN